MRRRRAGIFVSAHDRLVEDVGDHAVTQLGRMQIVHADQVQVVFHAGVHVDQDDALGCRQRADAVVERRDDRGDGAAVPQTVGALGRHGRQRNLDVQRLGDRNHLPEVDNRGIGADEPPIQQVVGPFHQQQHFRAELQEERAQANEALGRELATHAFVPHDRRLQRVARREPALQQHRIGVRGGDETKGHGVGLGPGRDAVAERQELRDAQARRPLHGDDEAAAGRLLLRIGRGAANGRAADGELCGLVAGHRDGRRPTGGERQGNGNRHRAASRSNWFRSSPGRPARAPVSARAPASRRSRH